MNPKPVPVKEEKPHNREPLQLNDLDDDELIKPGDTPKSTSDLGSRLPSIWTEKQSSLTNEGGAGGKRREEEDSLCNEELLSPTSNSMMDQSPEQIKKWKSMDHNDLPVLDSKNHLSLTSLPDPEASDSEAVEPHIEVISGEKESPEPIVDSDTSGKFKDETMPEPIMGTEL